MGDGGGDGSGDGGGEDDGDAGGDDDGDVGGEVVAMLVVWMTKVVLMLILCQT